MRSGLALFLCLVVFSALQRVAHAEHLLNATPERQDVVAAPDPTDLKILVITGEDGINIVKKKTAVQPVVEVRDSNNSPVSGAIVNFTTPSGNPSAVFSNGGRTLSLTTDIQGRAAISGMQPVGTGQFQIRVSASLSGRVVATTNIVQTNFATVAAAASSGAVASTGAASGGLSTGAIAAIVIGAAAAATLGGVLAMHGGGGAPSTPSATIGLASGAGAVGPPH